MSSITGALAGTLDLSGLTVTTPVIVNQSIVSANTEYSYALPANTKRFKIQNRNEGLVKLSYNTGESGTKYWSIFPGQQYDGENISDTASLTIYYQSPKASQTLEVISWS